MGNQNSDISDILKETCKHKFDSILDIGLGSGAASEYFLNQGKKVCATGFDTDSYSMKPEVKKNIKLFKDVSVEDMKCFKDNQFDAIWCAHVLEHTQNPGAALQEIKRVLKPDGSLFLIVPKFWPHIAGGHVTPGWNLGIVMQNLIRSGFNIKKGNFVRHGFNIVAFVKNGEIPKEKLRYDYGDINILKRYFPMDVHEGLNGDLKQVNWCWTKSNLSISTRLWKIIIENLANSRTNFYYLLLKIHQDILYVLRSQKDF